MRRRKQLATEDNTQRWIISYAELLTLLFAFFVVMYAVSSINAEKLKRFVASTNQAFDPKQQLGLQNDIQDLVIPEDLDVFKKEDVNIRQNKQWSELEIKSKALFQAGSAEPNMRAKILISKLAETLKQTKNFISVEGYTDNRPINSDKYASNWELSAARAAAVVRLLIEEGVDPKKIQAVGFGDTHPIASNEDVDGRSLNRRVVIVVAKDQLATQYFKPERIARKQPNKTKPVKKTVAKSDKVESAEKSSDKAKTLTSEVEQVEVPVVKTIRLKNGGLKITRGTAKVNKGEAVPLFVEDNKEE